MPPTISKSRDLLGTIWVIGMFVLMIGGGPAGMISMALVVRATKLLEVQPALMIPGVVAVIAVGGLTGLALAVGTRALPGAVRAGRLVGYLG